jgi:hypothetical protein
MSYTNEQAWKNLNRIVSVIPKSYLDALLILSERLEGKNLKWVIDGDLGELMRVVQIEPNCVEIVTSKDDAQHIFQEMQEFNPSAITLQTIQLQRNALVYEKEYPVYVRSHYFEFNLNGLLVKVQGDLQFKVADWDWGDIYDFDPEYVYVVGKKIAVTPLDVRLQLHETLGWADRAERIKLSLHKPLTLKNRQTQ